MSVPPSPAQAWSAQPSSTLSSAAMSSAAMSSAALSSSAQVFPTQPGSGRSGSGPAVLLVIGSCLSLQFGAAAAAVLFPVLGSWGTTLLRLGLAAVVLLCVARPGLRGWSPAQWRAALALGIALAGMNGTFYAAIARIPLGAAVAIEFLGPLALAAILTRRGRDLAWVFLAVGGTLLLGLESLVGAEPLDPTGAMLALIAGLFWAFYIQTGARVGSLIPGTGGLAVGLLVATALVAPFGIAGAVRALGHPHLLLLGAATALLASVVPYSLELAAMRRVPRQVFGILLSLEPVAATAIGWLLLGQSAGPLRIAAIVLVVAASAGSSRSGGRKSSAPAPAGRGPAETRDRSVTEARPNHHPAPLAG